MAENKSEKTQEEVVSSQPQVSSTEELVQKNAKLFGVAVVALLAVFAGVYFYMSSAEASELDADVDLYRAEYWFAKDSLDLALEGDGNEVIGFTEVADMHSGTDAGNLANLYAGVAYMNKGEYESAIEYLEKFSSNDLIFQARAYSLLGDANLELDNLSAAISNYEKATKEKPNAEYTPVYMLKLALAYELNGDKQAAIDTYAKLIKDFPKASTEVKEAKKYKAKLEAELS